MKYTKEIIINKPLREVWDKFTDEHFITEWQPSFVSVEVIEGTPGKVGSKSMMKFIENGREVVLQEEITERTDYKSMSMIYTTNGVINNMNNVFIEENNKTIYRTENEFIFTTALMKIIGFLMGWMFKAQTEKTLRLFKEAVEK
jgi:uncharacterized protein YndB with AHSA1/START domain